MGRGRRREHGRLKGGGKPVAGVNVCPGDKVLAWGYDGKTLTLWDATSGKQLLRTGQDLPTIPDHAVAASRDGKVLAVEDRDGVVHLWDVASGEMRRQFGGNQQVYRGTVAFADGKPEVLAVSHDAVRLVGPSHGQRPRRQMAIPEFGSLSPVVLSPDGRFLALVVEAPAGATSVSGT